MWSKNGEYYTLSSIKEPLIGMSVISTKRYYYGMRNEIILQASIKLPFLYILFNDSIDSLIVFFIWLLLTISYVVLLIRNIKEDSNKLNFSIANNYNESSNCFTINNGLILDTSLCKLV